MKKLVFILVLAFLVTPQIFAQKGQFLLVGGGLERTQSGAWNVEPYQWAVNQAKNKKVAIIGYGKEDDPWLRNYFFYNCKAATCVYFNISHDTIINKQKTYDSLMMFDMHFIKGGDQYQYYSRYKGTKIQQAIQDKFNAGGIIAGTSAGMAILSNVVYTAQNGTAYPDECIENPNNEYITLAGDFLNLFPNYLFDTHFAQRGRFARLVSFVANWKLNHNQEVTGLGLDDLTALAIDSNRIGKVYGTGNVTFIRAKSANTFSISTQKLLADTVDIQQLLHGCTINFNTGAVTGLNTDVQPTVTNETGDYTILASGSDFPLDNAPMLNALCNEIGLPTDSILIVTNDTYFADSLRKVIALYGQANVVIDRAITTMQNDSAFNHHIKSVKKIIVYKNDFKTFMNFISGDGNGEQLKRKLLADNITKVFVGDNSRFAGNTVIENYLEPSAAYDSLLTFAPGLNLLRTSIIMPNTFLNTDVYENTVTSVPYTLVRNGLKYGFWLTNHNYMKYAPQNGKTYVSSYGTAPLMIMRFDGSNTGFSTHSSTGYGACRMLAGFYNATFSMIDQTTPYKVGDMVISDVEQLPTTTCNVTLYPNPANQSFRMTTNGNIYDIMIYDLTGKLILQEKNIFENKTISVQSLPVGIYFVRMLNLTTNEQITRKLVIQH